MTSLAPCQTDILLRDTALLNEKGAALLLAGDDKSAVACLTQSLMIVKRLLNVIDEEDTQSLSQSQSQLSSASITDAKTTLHSSSSSSFQILQPSSVVLPNLNHPQIESFIYDRVVTFVSDNANNGNIKLHAASVVFNLALAHHRRAIILAMAGNLSSSKLCMEKAKQLYQMVLQLLPEGFGVVNPGDKSASEQPCVYSDMTRMVRLAAINNLCQIHYEQGLYDQVHDGLGDMLTLIYQAEAEASSSWSFRALFRANEWDGFLLNILMTRPNVAAAA
jgi:hypothetical protein